MSSASSDASDRSAARRAPHGRLRRGLHIAFIAAIAATALVALASWLLAGPGAGAALRVVERRIGSAVGGEARLGRLELRLWRLEARFHDLTVVLPAVSGSPLHATVEDGTARLAWSGLAGLAGGRLHLRELDLRGAQIGIGIDGGV